MKGQNLGQFIGGKFERGHGDPISIVNPSSCEEIARVSSADDTQVEKACGAAQEAFLRFSQLTPADRSELLLKIADRIEKKFEEVAALEALNTGKPVSRIISDELHTIVDPFRFYAGAIRTQLSLAPNQYVKGFQSWAQYFPYGVTGLIIPWNYPLMMACWKIAPALAAGNTVVVKPSEVTPLSMLKFAELVQDIIPRGVLNVLTGDGKAVGEPLVQNKHIQLVSFTGSIETGKRIHQMASERLIDTHFELGGNAPVIVYDDADWQQALDQIVIGGFYNSGQDCTAACRLFVHEKIYDSFYAEYVQRVKKLEDTRNEKYSILGPMLSEAHYQKVLSVLERAKSDQKIKGRWFDSHKQTGFYISPSVFWDVPFEHELCQTEVFGPIVSITPFNDSVDIVAKANETEYGLAASVWSKNSDRLMDAMNRLQYGTVWANTHLQWPTEMPHGGMKQSGNGKEMSVFGLNDYQITKHLMMSV